MNYKKTIIILSAVLIIGIIIFLLIPNNKNEKPIDPVIKDEEMVVFKLEGDQSIIIYVNEEYDEKGITAINENGIDLKNYVTTTGTVDVSTPGIYEITYSLNYKTIKRTLKRKVEVTENPVYSYVFILNGEEKMYLRKGTTYKELGCGVFDDKENDYSSDVIITGKVNTNQVGEYKIKYTYSKNDVERTLERTIEVYDLTYNITKSDLGQTEGPITITISSSSPNIDYMATLNGLTSKTILQQIVTENGVYYFYIYDIYGNKYSEKVNVNNIVHKIEEPVTPSNPTEPQPEEDIKSKYRCDIIINYKGSTLTMYGSSTTPITKYTYVLNNLTYTSDQKTYELPYKKVTTGKAILTANNKYYEFDCNIINNLIYDFKYVDQSNKPTIKCGAYTSIQKTELEKQLSYSIQEAGYGTRAGVVAAARFFVGALDYKVPYQGPKKINSEIGRYPRKGLNIGKSGAWGCNVSGYTQGIDCTNFVYWAFINGGVETPGVYSTKNVYTTASVVNQIRPGDFMLNPCGDSCRFEAKFSHIALVIGVDSNYIYVAEARSGDTAGVVITKLNKYALPNRLTATRLYQYKSDGNLTDMWVQ